MWFKALQWILGFLGGSVLQELTGYLKDKKRIEATVLNQAILGEMRSREVAAQVVLAEQGWWVTKWIRPLFAYPLIVYYAMHIYDALFYFPYHIQHLPPHVEEWSAWIVTAYFFTRPFEKIFRGWMTTSNRI